MSDYEFYELNEQFERLQEAREQEEDQVEGTWESEAPDDED